MVDYKRTQLAISGSDNSSGGRATINNYTTDVYNNSEVDVAYTETETEEVSEKPISKLLVTEDIILKNSVRYYGSKLINNAILALGTGNVVDGQDSLAIGVNNNIEKEKSAVLGYSNSSKGINNYIIGHTNVSYSGSIVGHNNTIEENAVDGVAIGNNLITASNSQVAVGTYNERDTDAAFLIGHGTSDARKTIFKVDNDGGIYGSAFYQDGVKITEKFINDIKVVGDGNSVTNVSLNKGIISFAKNETFCKQTDFVNLKNSLYDLIIPIGKVIITADSDYNPNTEYTGTVWEQMKDMMIMAAGDDYDIGSTGGEANVTLSVSNIPKHNHTVNNHSHPIPELTGVAKTAGGHHHSVSYADTVNDIASGFSLGTNLGYLAYTNDAGEHVHDVTITASETETSNPDTTYAGAGIAHNNLPPYKAFNVWVRIS